MSDLDNEFRVALEAAVAGFGLDQLTDDQSARLVKHYAMLCLWNKRINLTRIVGVDDAANLHYAESLFGAQFTAGARSILDIGSGAGFPAIPLAVVKPDVQVTALEANRKKALFLKEAKDELGLVNLDVETARLEEFDWAGYDLLTCRALDRAELILPAIIGHLVAKQRLMLYCAVNLAAKLEEQSGKSCKIETHSIPQSEARIISVFTKE